MIEKQRTLKAPFSISGVGLHTGETANLTILPAKPNHGYKFQRVDLDDQPIIPADIDLVVSTSRGTTLEKNGVRIYTTEHLLAALYGMDVDNALIQIDASEIPILDGSSSAFVKGIEEVGTEEQDAEREYFELTENIYYEEDGVEMMAVPPKGNDYKVVVMVDYQSPVLGTQHAALYEIEEFKEQFSQCRTFVFLRELEILAEKNLIKGGDVDNAIVLIERPNVSQKELDHLAKKLSKEGLEVKVEGIGTLNNVKLHFENEPARHKLLDMIGDLALVGVRFKGHFLAARPGHRGNTEFGKILKEKYKASKKLAPKFDLNKEPVYDINDIQSMLPHRPPFLFVDKIIEMNESYIVGVKNVTMNEPFFQGHFPENPVMPGVLQIEAMAQVGGIFALSQVEDPENYSTYFMKIKNVRFKSKVVPGDTIIFKLELLTPIRRGIVHMKGVAYAADKPATEAEMMAKIVKERNL